MKKFLAAAIFSMMVTFLVAGSAMAMPVGNALQNVLDSRTISPNPGDSSVNVLTDYMNDDLDSYWEITASGGAFATIIVEIAGYANGNRLGIFDLFDPTKKVEVFAGSDSPGATSTISIKLDGSVEVDATDTGVDFAGNQFGWYFINQPGNTFYSDTSLNGDNFDHMLVYQGTNTDYLQLGNNAPGLWTNNEYVYAWEDLPGGGDKDFADMVLMVESVTTSSVPEPGTMLLLGTGLIGFAVFGRRRIFKKS